MWDDFLLCLMLDVASEMVHLQILHRVLHHMGNDTGFYTGEKGNHCGYKVSYEEKDILDVMYEKSCIYLIGTI